MRLASLLPLFALAACNVDGLASNGELGHLNFALLSDWFLEPTELTDVGIVTGHPQSIDVTLTDRGERAADDDAHSIVYALVPDDGVTLEQEGPDGDDATAPWMTVTVTDPGDYTLEATLDGDAFDRIQLRFDTPVSLDLAQFTRAPYADDFVAITAGDPVPVVEGTQLAWLPIPVGGAGDRLAGTLASGMTADPADLVVPAENVTHVNEDEPFTGSAPSLYFIDPGTVTVTITDTVNPASGAQVFDVRAATGA